MICVNVLATACNPDSKVVTTYTLSHVTVYDIVSISSYLISWYILASFLMLSLSKSAERPEPAPSLRPGEESPKPGNHLICIIYIYIIYIYINIFIPYGRGVCRWVWGIGVAGGVGRGDDHVHWTCQHGWCYARSWVGVGWGQVSSYRA